MHPLRPLKKTLLALVVALIAALTAPLGAQTRVTRDAEVRATPDGNVVAEVRSGTSWRAGASRGGFTLVTLQGWVESSRFAGRADSFPQSIGGSSGLRLREQPTLEGRILGEFRGGAGFHVIERRGNWARVRRDAWIASGSLARAAASSSPSGTAAGTGAKPSAKPESRVESKAESKAESRSESTAGAETDATEVAPAGALRAGVGTTLRRSPTGDAIGRLEAGAVVQPLARDRGWVRIRVEAWVPDSLLTPADTSYGAHITAADLRLDPEGHKGKVLRWAVEIVGLQTADPLRRDMRPDEPYLLAMGPGTENAILYIAVPPALLEEARALAPLSKVFVTARVRSGRSQPTGAPVLVLISIIKR
ncbi:MAG: SH3 domain-containing protein [Gemmatimonadaceae bacterium]